MKIGNNETLKASCIQAAAVIAKETSEDVAAEKVVALAVQIYDAWLAAERDAHTHDLSW